jgi:hypothetical protein
MLGHKKRIVLQAVILAVLLLLAAGGSPCAAGEADLVVQVGDMDNLGFGWPEGYDVFSGESTPFHEFEFYPGPNDPPGTDKIMLGTSYIGDPPAGADGYTDISSRPDNLPVPIRAEYDLKGIQVSSATLQIFVDDFQSPVFQSDFQVSINGQRAPFLEAILNSLDQTGAAGRLISAPVPPDFLPHVASGVFEIYIDDPTTGAGDGFAVDFVRLMINPGGSGAGGSNTSGGAGNGVVIILQIDNPYMKVNGSEKEIDPGKGTAPVIVSGRTLVPIRAIIESMGGTIDWYSPERKVTVQQNGSLIELWIGKTTTRVNGVSKITDVAPNIINERTMLPLRFVSENLGCDVKWHENTKEVTISFTP